MKDLLWKNKKNRKSVPVKTTFREMIFLFVAVENGLDNIKNYLLSKGFCVVDMNFSFIDAFIYLRKENLSLYNSSSNTNKSILMVNAYNKTNQDIERILTSKLYSPLF